MCTKYSTMLLLRTYHHTPIPLRQQVCSSCHFQIVKFPDRPGAAKSRALVQYLSSTQRRTAATTTTTGRPPLPPMPRVLPPPPQPSPRRGWWSSGNLLIGIGWIGLAVIAIDRYLQYEQHAESMALLQSLADETAQRRLALQAEWSGATPLYQVTVVREYKGMGGSHGLRGLQVGDVLDVLKENEGVGNDMNYYLCRRNGVEDGGHEIGWYPMGFVEKIPQHRRWFSFWKRS